MPSNPLAYGVAYSPSDFDTPKPGLTVPDLQTRNIKYVRIQWVDFSNQIRYKVLSLAYFTKLVEKSTRPGITSTSAVLSIVAGGVSPGFFGIGEWLYVLDLSTLREATYAPGHAVVMGYWEEEVPHPKSGVEISLCPRTALRKVVQ